MKAKTPEQRVSALLSKKNARYKFRQLQSLAGLNARQLDHAIAEIRKTRPDLVYAKFDRTYYFAKTPTWYSNQTDLSAEMPLEGKFGLISDTHLGSVAERLDIVREAYAEFASQGITKVFHCGDLTDGWQEYRGHINFVKVFGDQPQALHVIRNYPKHDGVTTYVIGGNHDDSYKHTQLDRVSLVSKGFHHQGRDIEGRKDIVYLGQYSHRIILPQEVTMDLLHPRGGNPYARSYKAQKRSENMDRNLRPDIQCSGHFHAQNFIWLNHTYFIDCPGLQDETEFFKRLGFPRSVGYQVVEYEIRNGRLVSLRPQLFMIS